MPPHGAPVPASPPPLAPPFDDEPPAATPPWPPFEDPALELVPAPPPFVAAPLAPAPAAELDESVLLTLPEQPPSAATSETENQAQPSFSKAKLGAIANIQQQTRCQRDNSK
jgi:hypothetical protein